MSHFDLDRKFNLNFSLNNGNNNVGRLYEDDNGLLCFEGCIQESGKILIDYVCNNVNSEVVGLRLKLTKQQEEIAELVGLLDRLCGIYDSEEIAHHFGIDHESAVLIINKLAKHNKGE